jgi:hypothetical protein
MNFPKVIFPLTLLLILSPLLVYSATCDSAIYINYTQTTYSGWWLTGRTTFLCGGGECDYYTAQQFKINNSVTVSFIELQLGTEGTCTANNVYTLSIQNLGLDGYPNMSSNITNAYSNLACGNLSSGAWVNYSFANPVSLSAGGYWLVWVSNESSGVKYWRPSDRDANINPDGSESYYNSHTAVWINESARDIGFRLWNCTPPGSSGVAFNGNTEADGNKKYNITSQSIFANVSVTNLTSTNTTIYLYNTTGLYASISNTTNQNFSYNFTGLPNNIYYLNATSTDGSTQINSTTRTITIYGMNTNINTPTNYQQITRNINITYNTTIQPTEAVTISQNNISFLNSDETLNFSINTSTNTTPYIYDTLENNLSTGLYKIRIEATNNLSNKSNATININLTRNALLNITAKYILTNATITNFTINITNQNTGTTETINTTTNTTSISIIKDRNYTITIDSLGYALSNITNQSFNATFNNYTFQLYTNNSVFINIYDETTGYPITSNITIVFTLGLTEITNTTTSGTYYQDGLTEGTWDIKFSGGNYTLKTYVITVANKSTQTLNAYLTTSTQYTIFTIMDYDTGTTLEGATITQSRLINGSYTIVNVKNSDITGRAQLPYVLTVKYQFLITLSGYDSDLFYLDPILFTTYNIRLTKTTTLTPENTPDLTAIDVNYYNNLTGSITWYANSTNTLIWIISSPIGSLDTYNLTLTYPGGNQIANGSLATGEQFTMPFNITTANISSKVIINYCYKSTTSYNKCFTFPYAIIGSYGNQSMLANKDRTYGLSPFERILIVTIIVLAVGGAFFMLGGFFPGLLISILIMGFFMSIGFTTLWMNLPSLFIGLIILFRGRE